MKTAKEMLEAGDLRGAIAALTDEVKKNPTDTPRRIFLFELLCFAGEWDRAEKQIDVIGQQSPEAALGVLAYRNNLTAERERARLFATGAAPHFLTEPPAYIDQHVEAIRHLSAGEAASARELLDRAEEERPALSGKWNGEAFEDFRDYDDFVGPVLELIVKDQYAWLPFEQIRRVEIEAPRKLRDLVWAPARIEAADQTVGEVFVPALYARSSEHASDAVRLGRETQWEPAGDGLVAGAGLRLFLTGDVERPVLETRLLEFEAGNSARIPGPS